MKTKDDLMKIEAQILKINEEWYGTVNIPKRTDWTLAESKNILDTRNSLYQELLKPTWKEAGLGQDAEQIAMKFHHLDISMISCPSCEGVFTTKKYSDTLSFFESAFGSIKATLGAINKPEQTARYAGGIGKKIIGFATGNAYRSEELRICTNCKQFLTNCPYCSFRNSLNGKISHEGQETRCRNCEKAYAVYIHHPD